MKNKDYEKFGKISIFGSLLFMILMAPFTSWWIPVWVFIAEFILIAVLSLTNRMNGRKNPLSYSFIQIAKVIEISGLFSGF